MAGYAIDAAAAADVTALRGGRGDASRDSGRGCPWESGASVDGVTMTSSHGVRAGGIGPNLVAPGGA